MKRQQTDPSPRERIDVDLHLARPARHRASDAALLAVIAVGGAVGATARYFIGQPRPTHWASSTGIPSPPCCISRAPRSGP